MKRLPIGIENFKELISKDYYYVDKTHLISDVINEKVILFTRPRRFGKTLNMSMLYYFFSIKEKDNANLFDNLTISNNIEAIKHQNQYPVIFLTFKDMKQNSYDMQIENFRYLISDLVKSFPELLESTSLTESDKRLLNSYINKEASITDLMNALKQLTMMLSKHYGKNVIILIDEYDVPLHSAYLRGYYDEMVDLLRGFLSAGLKTNDALEKGILTGCLRIAKESIFTGLNNFSVNTIMNKKSNKAFGFTQADINKILCDYQLEKYEDVIKDWYDGYLFGDCEVYNPWSTLMYINKAKEEDTYEPISFWANTSSNEIVYNYIKEGNATLHDEFEELMQGKTLIKHIQPELTYRDMDNMDYIYSYLLFTGYLKAIRKVDFNTYEITIPNKEVYQIYQESFINYFRELKKSKKGSFVNALKNGNLEEAETILSEILQRSLSYYDNYENFYHGFLLGILEGYNVESNVEAGEGRLDLVIYPNIFRDTAIVIECKHSNSMDSLVKDSKLGAKQIIEKKYLDGIMDKGYQKAIGYGISFYKKRCAISPSND